MKTLIMIIIFALAFVGLVGFTQTIIDHLKKWKDK